MREQESRINHVELRNLEGLPDIGRAILDVADAQFPGFRSRQIQLGLVDVESDHLSGRCDASRQLQRYVSAAAAYVCADEPVTKSQPVEKSLRTSFQTT